MRTPLRSIRPTIRWPRSPRAPECQEWLTDPHFFDYRGGERLAYPFKYQLAKSWTSGVSNALEIEEVALSLDYFMTIACICTPGSRVLVVVPTFHIPRFHVSRSDPLLIGLLLIPPELQGYVLLHNAHLVLWRILALPTGTMTQGLNATYFMTPP